MLIDESGLAYNFFKYVPFWLTRNPDTARSLLSALAGGLISLTVFSFTMVMVVLNQANSNYTPRALPGLISQKSHQVVLGIYLGSIGFTITVLTNIEGQNYRFVVPELALVVNAVLGFMSFVAFVYFIHSISQKIQLGTILTNLYNTTLTGLKEEQNECYVKLIDEDTDNWQVYNSPISGYFHSINIKKLLEIAHEENLKFKFLTEKGAFLLDTTPMFCVCKPISEEVQEKVFSIIVYRHQEDLKVNYLYGFKQITEMALRALSPGINDPATAIQAIDYLCHLFAEQMKIQGYRVYKDDLDIKRLFFTETPFSQIYYLTMGSIRNYSGSDMAVQLKLIQAIERLLPLVEGEKEVTQALLSEKQAIKEICQQVYKTEKDKAIMLEAIN